MLLSIQKFIGTEDIASVHLNGSNNNGMHHDGHEEHRLVISDSPESRPFLEYMLEAVKARGRGRQGHVQQARGGGCLPQLPCACTCACPCPPHLLQPAHPASHHPHPPPLQAMSLGKYGVAVLGATFLKRKDNCLKRGLGWQEGKAALRSITDKIGDLNATGQAAAVLRHSVIPFHRTPSPGYISGLFAGAGVRGWAAQQQQQQLGLMAGPPVVLPSCPPARQMPARQLLHAGRSRLPACPPPSPPRPLQPTAAAAPWWTRGATSASCRPPWG